jgi:hypothetical protein
MVVPHEVPYLKYQLRYSKNKSKRKGPNGHFQNSKKLNFDGTQFSTDV